MDVTKHIKCEFWFAFLRLVLSLIVNIEHFNVEVLFVSFIFHNTFDLRNIISLCVSFQEIKFFCYVIYIYKHKKKYNKKHCISMRIKKIIYNNVILPFIRIASWTIPLFLNLHYKYKRKFNEFMITDKKCTKATLC